MSVTICDFLSSARGVGGRRPTTKYLWKRLSADRSNTTTQLLLMISYGEHVSSSLVIPTAEHSRPRIPEVASRPVATQKTGNSKTMGDPRGKATVGSPLGDSTAGPDLRQHGLPRRWEFTERLPTAPPRLPSLSQSLSSVFTFLPRISETVSSPGLSQTPSSVFTFLPRISKPTYHLPLFRPQSLTASHNYA